MNQSLTSAVQAARMDRPDAVRWLSEDAVSSVFEVGVYEKFAKM